MEYQNGITCLVEYQMRCDIGKKFIYFMLLNIFVRSIISVIKLDWLSHFHDKDILQYFKLDQVQF